MNDRDRKAWVQFLGDVGHACLDLKKALGSRIEDEELGVTVEIGPPLQFSGMTLEDESGTPVDDRPETEPVESDIVKN